MRVVVAVRTWPSKPGERVNGSDHINYKALNSSDSAALTPKHPNLSRKSISQIHLANLSRKSILEICIAKLSRESTSQM